MTAIDAEQRYAPGVHDIPEEAYFGARYALSCSGAKLLIPPSCPAKFFYAQDHPVTSEAFDLGHAAHRLVLGSGGDIVEVKADDWRTKAAKEAATAARAAGATPLLTRQVRQVEDMAAALRLHPVAAALLDPYWGKPEQSLFWDDPRTGIPLRARLDWLPAPAPGERMVIPDYKTTDSADPAGFARSVGTYAYHQQHAWYCDAVRVLGLDDDPAFVFIAQEKHPPYIVTVFELAPEAVRIGANRNNYAIDTYRACVASGEWPAYSDEIEEIALPAWARTGEDPL